MFTTNRVREKNEKKIQTVYTSPVLTLPLKKKINQTQCGFLQEVIKSVSSYHFDSTFVQYELIACFQKFTKEVANARRKPDVDQTKFELSCPFFLLIALYCCLLLFLLFITNTPRNTFVFL